MRLDGTIPISPRMGLFTQQENTVVPNTGNLSGFKTIFDDLAQAASQASAESREARALLLTGQLDDLPAAVIAGERSGILFELNLNMRNKVIDAYQEVMRTQI